jgi:hypothetical protein
MLAERPADLIAARLGEVGRRGGDDRVASRCGIA